MFVVVPCLPLLPPPHFNNYCWDSSMCMLPKTIHQVSAPRVGLGAVNGKSWFWSIEPIILVSWLSSECQSHTAAWGVLCKATNWGWVRKFGSRSQKLQFGGLPLDLPESGRVGHPPAAPSLDQLGASDPVPAVLGVAGRAWQWRQSPASPGTARKRASQAGKEQM